MKFELLNPEVCPVRNTTKNMEPTNEQIVEFVIRDSAGTIMLNGEFNIRNIYQGLNDGLIREGYKVPDPTRFTMLILQGMADNMLN